MMLVMQQIAEVWKYMYCTMPQLTDLVVQNRNSIYFTLEKYKESECNSVFHILINYYKRTCMENSVDPDLSLLPQKPADLDLCCLQ